MTGQKEIVLVPWALSAALDQALAAYKFIYITAPTGWGKTTAVRRYFRGRRYTYASLWDEDALDRVAADSTALVILDDCHVLEDQPCLCKRVESLLRETPADAHVLLLSRAPLPDWLFPFQLTGLLTVIRDEVFQLGAEDVAKLAEETGLALSQEDVLRLHRESRGFPVAAKIICLRLAEGKQLTTETVNSGYSQMFAYFDRQLFSYWDGKIRRLLLSVSFFDSFTLELARALTGDSQTEQTLHHLLRISSFLDTDGKTYTIRYPLFRGYLQHKAETTWSAQERPGAQRPVLQRRGVLPAQRRPARRPGVLFQRRQPRQGVRAPDRACQAPPRPWRLLSAAQILPQPAGEGDPGLAGAHVGHEHPLLPDLRRGRLGKVVQHPEGLCRRPGPPRRQFPGGPGAGPVSGYRPAPSGEPAHQGHPALRL